MSHERTRRARRARPAVALSAAGAFSLCGLLPSSASADPIAVGAGDRASEVMSATSTSGDAVVAYLTEQSLVVARRAPGAAANAWQVGAAAPGFHVASHPDVGVTADGRTIVTWREGTRPPFRLRAAIAERGAPFDAPMDVSQVSAGPSLSGGRIAALPSGAAVVAFVQGSSVDERQVRIAVLAAGSSRFAVSKGLAPAGDQAIRTKAPSVVASGSGALLGWSGRWRGYVKDLVVARLDRAGRMTGRPRVLSHVARTPPLLASTPSGSAVAAWSAPNGTVWTCALPARSTRCRTRLSATGTKASSYRPLPAAISDRGELAVAVTAESAASPATPYFLTARAGARRWTRTALPIGRYGGFEPGNLAFDAEGSVSTLVEQGEQAWLFRARPGAVPEVVGLGASGATNYGPALIRLGAGVFGAWTRPDAGVAVEDL